MPGTAIDKVKEPGIPSAELLDKEPADEELRQQLDPIVANIPDSLWKPREEDIGLYLMSEFSIAEGERGDFIDDLERWKVVYRAPQPELSYR